MTTAIDFDDIRFTPALELAAMVESRSASPVEITAAILTGIETHNPALGAYLTVTSGLAMEQALQAERRASAGERLSALDGVPYSLKDLEPTAGVRTTMGSRWFEDHVPAADSLLARRVRSAGGVLLGKTNTPQFGYTDSGRNLIGPPARNPWDPSRTPGGSSAGAAVAVAAGLGPLAHGSDGAGSIRIPASLCGVVGMKPSFGRVPGFPNSCHWAAFAQSGPLSRTVRDAALFLQVMAGPDPRDPLSIDSPPRDYVRECDGDLRGLRVAVTADLGYAPVDPEVRAVFTAAAERFIELGCTVEQTHPGWPDPAEGFKRFNAVVHAAAHGERVRAKPEWAEPGLQALIAEGETCSGIEFQQTLIERTTLYQRAVEFFEEWDLLVTPTMPVAAWPASDAEPEHPVEIDGTPTPNLIDHLPFTFPFNMTGQPAISVPAGFTTVGLPVGLQIVGGWHADHLVLKAAAAFEQAAPWAGLRPVDDDVAVSSAAARASR
jgi:Asp-tRNA(Asn)/Glu-tRNA(Gln) amidotransferase A subunit family amidase